MKELIEKLIDPSLDLFESPDLAELHITSQVIHVIKP